MSLPWIRPVWDMESALTVNSGAPPPSYVGPGDIIPGAAWWSGLRGYTAALSDGTHPAVDLQDQAGGNQLTGVKILSTGALDVATISAWVTANSVTSIRVVKLYDQTGNGVHWTAAAATAPRLILGAQPSLGFVAGVTCMADGLAPDPVDQPYSISIVYKDTGTPSATGGLLYYATTGLAVAVYSNDGVDNETMFYLGGGNLNSLTTATNNAWHAVQCVANGVSSNLNLDGADSIFDSGTRVLNSSTHRLGDTASLDQPFIGEMVEVGVWTSAFVTPADMYNNQHIYWSF
jgi:hypothetical protein